MKQGLLGYDSWPLPESRSLPAGSRRVSPFIPGVLVGDRFWGQVEHFRGGAGQRRLEDGGNQPDKRPECREGKSRSAVVGPAASTRILHAKEGRYSIDQLRAPSHNSDLQLPQLGPLR